MMESLIKLGGIYNIILVVFHLSFWQIFNWEDDLRSLSVLNKSTMQVVNLSLTIVFVIFAYISLVHTSELLSTPLGKSLLVSMALLWFARSTMQVIFYKLKHWSSVAFLIYFLAGGLLYGIPQYIPHRKSTKFASKKRWPGLRKNTAPFISDVSSILK